jgi:hypothetical protein
MATMTRLTGREAPAETIRQFLTTANAMLVSAGFTRNSKTSAPRTAKTNMAYIYTHGSLRGEIWVHSSLRWEYKRIQQGGISGIGSDRLATVFTSTRLTDLKQALSNSIQTQQGDR